MNLLEVYMAQLDVIENKIAFNDQKIEILAKMEAELKEQKNIVKQKVNSEPSVTSNPRGQISYKNLSELVRDILITRQSMSEADLEEYLFQSFGLKWKSFHDTMRTLRRNNLLSYKKEKVDGIFQFTLDE
jgi:hypothetical protein